MTPVNKIPDSMTYAQAIEELFKLGYRVLYNPIMGDWLVLYNHSVIGESKTRAEGWVKCYTHYAERHTK